MSKFKGFGGGPVLSFRGGPEPPKHGPACSSTTNGRTKGQKEGRSGATMGQKYFDFSLKPPSLGKILVAHWLAWNQKKTFLFLCFRLCYFASKGKITPRYFTIGGKIALNAILCP